MALTLRPSGAFPPRVKRWLAAGGGLLMLGFLARQLVEDLPAPGVFRVPGGDQIELHSGLFGHDRFSQAGGNRGFCLGHG